MKGLAGLLAGTLVATASSSAQAQMGPGIIYGMRHAGWLEFQKQQDEILQKQAKTRGKELVDISHHIVYSVGPGQLKNPLRVERGDVVRIASDPYPQTKEYEGARIKVTFLEDLAVLNEAGQLYSVEHSPENHIQRVILLNVAEYGDARVLLTLVDEQGKPYKGFDTRTYLINSKDLGPAG